MISTSIVFNSIHTSFLKNRIYTYIIQDEQITYAVVIAQRSFIIQMDAVEIHDTIRIAVRTLLFSWYCNEDC